MRNSCVFCKSRMKSKSGDRIIYRTGRFWRRSDGHWIQRFWCKSCKKGFSQATFSKAYRQKKRHKNELLRKLISGGYSLREASRTLRLNRKTVFRKFLYLAQNERASLDLWNKKKGSVLEVEFDDLETFEHTKCKPLSVSLFVEYKTRRILDFEVSQMPAKGKLAEFSRKKYGPRKDLRKAEG